VSACSFGEHRGRAPWKAPWKSGASAPRKPSINEPGFSPWAYWGTGLCECPQDWEWTSFRDYATGREGRVEIESEWTARKRERTAGRLSPALELPHSSQNQALSGPPVSRAKMRKGWASPPAGR
jgi:hypothetical protein